MKHVTIPSVQEMSVQRMLGEPTFELDTSRSIRHEIEALRMLVKKGLTQMVYEDLSTVDVPLFEDDSSVQFGKITINVVDAELRNLGYEVSREETGMYLTISLPVPHTFENNGNDLRLVGAHV